MTTASFSIFTDETAGFDPAHQGLRFTIAVFLPARRDAAESEIRRCLSLPAEPWGLPYHASEAEHFTSLGKLRSHLARRLRSGQWRTILAGLRRHAPALEAFPDTSLKRYLEVPHGALVPEIDASLRSALAGAPARVADAARALLGLGGYVLCAEHGQAAPREQWTRMMHAVVEHTLTLLALDAPRDARISVDVVPAESGGHATALHLGRFLEQASTSNLVATLDTAPDPPVVQAVKSPGIQLADIAVRELSRRARRGGPRFCHPAPLSQPTSWSAAMLHDRLPAELRPQHTLDLPARLRPPAWRIPAPLGGEEQEEPLSPLDPCFNACGALETHEALRSSFASPVGIPALQEKLRDALARKWRVRSPDGAFPAGFPFTRTLPFAYQMTLPLLDELARRAANPDENRSSPQDSSGKGTTTSAPGNSNVATGDLLPQSASPLAPLAWKAQDTMSDPSFEVSLPRVISLPSASDHPTLLLDGERAALTQGRDPYLWTVAVGRLLRWRDRAQVDRDLGKACRAVTAPELARIAGDGCALLGREIRELAEVVRGAAGPPNAAWGLLSARDDLESMRIALVRIEREMRRAEQPDLAEELDFQLTEIAGALPDLDAEIAQMNADILAGLVQWPDDPHRLRLDGLEIPLASADPGEAFRGVLDRLVMLQVQLASSNAVEDVTFVTDDLAMAHRSKESWFVATDVLAALPPSPLTVTEVRHVWLLDCGRRIELGVHARPREARLTLGVPQPEAAETPPPGSQRELPAETRAWLRARRRA